MKAEETRSIKRVGSYTTLQAYPEDCEKCGDAGFATVIIDGLCLDCLLDEVSRECAINFLKSQDVEYMRKFSDRTFNYMYTAWESKQWELAEE